MTQAAPRYAWLNGKIVPWEDCVLHGRTQGAFWGANVFEGVRAYLCPRDQQFYVFRLDDHLARLGRSMKSVRMDIPYSMEQLNAACLELVRANEFTEAVHLCVVAYFGMGHNFDPLSLTGEAGVHITAVPMPRSDGYRTGVAACVSSWRRISDDTMPPRIKAGANYQNSRLAHQEAVRNGFDTTLILNQWGRIAEAPGANVIMVKDRKLITPPGTSGVLEGITLDTVLRIAEDDLGLTIEKRDIDRTEAYVADEVFLCGTLAEILPVVSLDRLAIGKGVPGPITRHLQHRYERAVRAADPEYRDWVTTIGMRPQITVAGA
jgi:branched-chain amino acid aminotransferase